MNTMTKMAIAFLVAIAGSVLVVALSTGMYALTGSLVVKWVVHFVLLITLWVGMWKLGTKLGRMK